MNSKPQGVLEAPPSLREYWLLLDGFDWESYRKLHQEGAALPRQWYDDHARTFARILDIAKSSDEHSKLAANFEAAILSMQPRPHQPP